MFAIIHTSGHQYKVSVGDTVVFDKIDAKVGDVLTFPNVLLFSDGKTIRIGKPYLDDIAVTATVLEQGKGDKVRVARFKAKSRYRRVQGFRALHTTVRIESIGPKLAKPKTSKKSSSAKKTPTKKSEK